jgi:hypothetical protein
MGDVADMMLDGTLCECCGVYIDDEDGGFPRMCRSCESEGARVEDGCPGPGWTEKKFVWAKCTVCGRTVKAVGLDQHMRAKHAEIPVTLHTSNGAKRNS